MTTSLYSTSLRYRLLAIVAMAVFVGLAGCMKKLDLPPTVQVASQADNSPGMPPNAVSPQNQAGQGTASKTPGPALASVHPPEWINPASLNFHGKVVATAGDYTKAKFSGITCITCHAGSSATQSSPVAAAPNCFLCHSGGPNGSAGHPSTWLTQGDPNFHGTVVLGAGSDYTKARAGNLTCNTCHAGESATQASTNPSAPNCFLCHAGGPKGSAGHPSAWLTPGDPAFHGAAVQAAGNDYTKARAGNLTCNTCHAGDSPASASPNASAPNCFSCHAGGTDGSPGHPPGWTDPASPSFHGLVVEAASADYTVAKAGGLTCRTCHAGASPTAASPNSQAPNCYSCHSGGGPAGPHPAGWVVPRSPSFHGTFLAANGGYQNAKVNGQSCSTCHNTEQKAVSPLALAPNCFTCHAGGPTGSPNHPFNWVSYAGGRTQLHGETAKKDLTYCSRCHNTVAPFQKNPAPDVPVDCWSCHNGPKGG